MLNPTTAGTSRWWSESASTSTAAIKATESSDADRMTPQAAR